MNLTYQQKEIHKKLLYKKFYFDIELSSACNLNCTFCPREFLKRERKLMNKELIDILADWLPDKANVMIAGMGEPLLNKLLPYFINKVKTKNRVIGITTNGHLLSKNILDKLIKSGLDFLQVSINTLDSELYKSWTKSDFHKLLTNLENLKSIKKDLILQFSFIKDNLNIQNDNFEEFSKRYNANIFVKTLHNRGGYLYQQPKYELNTCYLFSQVTYITSDGDILYCCHDLEAKNKIGNIRTLSFNDILKLKEQIIENNSWIPLCNYCDDLGRKTIIK